MWREVITQLAPGCVFAPPATGEQIAGAEAALGIALPGDLHALLQESNGVEDPYGPGLIWPVEQIVADNLAYRHDPDFAVLFMPFDSLLFFADAGNGDLFAFPISTGAVRRPDIYLWSHETDSRTWVAPGLHRYLEARLHDELDT
jgi:hypothetical protein